MLDARSPRVSSLNATAVSNDPDATREPPRRPANDDGPPAIEPLPRPLPKPPPGPVATATPELIPGVEPELSSPPSVIAISRVFAATFDSALTDRGDNAAATSAAFW